MRKITSRKETDMKQITPKRRMNMASLAKSLAILTVLLSTSTAAYAGRVATPGIFRSRNLEQRLLCMVTNTTSGYVGPYTITIIDSYGTEVDSTTISKTRAGRINYLEASDADLGSITRAWCEVDGKGISKTRTPVTLCVTASTNSACQAAVSVP